MYQPKRLHHICWGVLALMIFFIAGPTTACAQSSDIAVDPMSKEDVQRYMGFGESKISIPGWSEESEQVIARYLEDYQKTLDDMNALEERMNGGTFNEDNPDGMIKVFDNVLQPLIRAIQQVTDLDGRLFDQINYSLPVENRLSAIQIDAAHGRRIRDALEDRSTFGTSESGINLWQLIQENTSTDVHDESLQQTLSEYAIMYGDVMLEGEKSMIRMVSGMREAFASGDPEKISEFGETIEAKQETFGIKLLDINRQYFQQVFGLLPTDAQFGFHRAYGSEIDGSVMPQTDPIASFIEELKNDYDALPDQLELMRTIELGYHEATLPLEQRWIYLNRQAEEATDAESSEQFKRLAKQANMQIEQLRTDVRSTIRSILTEQQQAALAEAEAKAKAEKEAKEKAPHQGLDF